MIDETLPDSLLPRKELETRDELEAALTEIGVDRARIIEVRQASMLLVFAEPSTHEKLFELLDTRLPEGIGFAIGSLSRWELFFVRRVYHII